jgi:hypothetical protein
VLCGHTHGGDVQIVENLRVVTGPAEYGKPQSQRIFEVEHPIVAPALHELNLTAPD